MLIIILSLYENHKPHITYGMSLFQFGMEETIFLQTWINILKITYALCLIYIYYL